MQPSQTQHESKNVLALGKNIVMLMLSFVINCRKEKQAPVHFKTKGQAMSWLEGFSLARLLEFNDNIKKNSYNFDFLP